jgi:hypothetical protein
VIADALRVEVERYAADMPRHNSLYTGAANGRLTPEMVGYYLFNVRYLVRHTPAHLERARARSLALGGHALAAHYAAKHAEEQGHDRWADRDLERLRDGFGAAPRGDYSVGLLGLLSHIEALIDRDPALYLAYILFAEYLIVLMGPAWLALIEERCGIPRSMFSVIGNHVELDREHTCEGLAAIDTLVRDPAMLEPMLAVLRETFTHFDRFSADVLALGKPPEAPCAKTSLD